MLLRRAQDFLARLCALTIALSPTPTHSLNRFLFGKLLQRSLSLSLSLYPAQLCNAAEADGGLS